LTPSRDREVGADGAGPAVAVFAWEVGSCTALVPVVEELVRIGCRCTVFAFPPAQAVFDNRLGQNVSVVPGISITERQQQWDVLLAGLGRWTQRPDEFESMRVAFDRKPSMILLDNWKGLERFFLPDGEPLPLEPTHLAVPDQHTGDALACMGLRWNSIVATGHPGLERCELGRSSLSARRAQTRKQLGISPNATVYVLASELMHGHSFYCGCDDSCASCLSALASHSSLTDALSCEGTADGEVVWVMRPHPNEHQQALPGTLHVSWEEADDLSILAVADRVYGLSSMLTAQAVASGIETRNITPFIPGWAPESVFLQPGTWDAVSKTGRWGRFEGVDEYPETHVGAASRVARLVLEAAGAAP